MPKQSDHPYAGNRREQHPVTFNPNEPQKTVAAALANSKKQVAKAKQK